MPSEAQERSWRRLSRVEGRASHRRSSATDQYRLRRRGSCQPYHITSRTHRSRRGVCAVRPLRIAGDVVFVVTFMAHLPTPEPKDQLEAILERALTAYHRDE